MPIDPVTGAIIGSTTSLIGNLVQNRTNRRLAEEQRQWNVKQWNREKQHAIDMWNMENAYNHPAEQMKRFAAAGLNPHLIYGKGSAGNASPISTPSVQGYNRAEANNIAQGVDFFQNFVNFRHIQAQTDNVEANTVVARQEAYNRAQEGISKAVKADVDLATKADMIRQAKALADKAFYDADIRDAESYGAWLDLGTKKRTQQSREKLVEQQLKNAILTGDLRQLEKNLNSIGLQKHDNYFIRMMAQSPEGMKQLKALAKSGMLPILLGISSIRK